MPFAPKKHAGQRGTRVSEAEKRAQRRAAEANRATPADRGYNHEWRKVRAAHLRDHPTCAHCGTSADLQVDHVTPFAGLADPLRLDPGNLRTLCRSCHGRVSAKHRHGAVRKATMW